MMTAAATVMVAATATAMAGPQTTINLSYRNGDGFATSTARVTMAATVMVTAE